MSTELESEKTISQPETDVEHTLHSMPPEQTAYIRAYAAQKLEIRSVIEFRDGWRFDRLSYGLTDAVLLRSGTRNGIFC